jgi:hypothetical protein
VRPPGRSDISDISSALSGVLGEFEGVREITFVKVAVLKDNLDGGSAGADKRKREHGLKTGNDAYIRSDCEEQELGYWKVGGYGANIGDDCKRNIAGSCWGVEFGFDREQKQGYEGEGGDCPMVVNEEANEAMQGSGR